MDVHTYERWQRVWTWWKETAEFKLEPNWYTVLDDAPKDAPDGMLITVMGEIRTDYERRKGQWCRKQEITEQDCMVIYGEE
jgi:hypothetical protein